jgi:hypothetical protein
MRGHFAAVVLAILGIAMAGPRAGRAQDDESLMPEESAAKAKALLQQVIAALGGDAYLNVRDFTCTGRAAPFEHSGAAGDSSEFQDFWLLPDKDRIEYMAKGANILTLVFGIPGKTGYVIDVYSGNQGWTMDKTGVNEQSAQAVSDFQDQVQTSLNYVLRRRLNEDGMTFRYAGADIVDLKPVDWVELVDSSNRTMRLAIEQSTHLPLQFVVITRDPETREENSRTTEYSEFLPSKGVMMPYNVVRMRNTLRVYQVFYTQCDVNTGLAPNLFTRQALEERYAKLGIKDKNK